MTDTSETLKNLTDEADLLVNSLSALKDRLESYKNAEDKLNSTTDSLLNLIDSANGQVKSANKLIEETSKVSVQIIVQWLQAIYAEVKKVDSVKDEIAKNHDSETEQLNRIQEGLGKLETGIGLLFNESAKINDSTKSVVKAESQIVSDSILSKLTSTEISTQEELKKLDIAVGLILNESAKINESTKNVVKAESQIVSNGILSKLISTDKKLSLLSYITGASLLISIVSLILAFL